MSAVNNSSFNNSVYIPENSSISYLWKQELIDNAQQSIELSPNYCGGNKFQEIISSLSKNLTNKNELKVHLLLSKDFLTQEDRDLLEKVKNTFPDRFEYLLTGAEFKVNPTYGTTENHEKFLIVDESFYIVGGSGISDTMCTTGDTQPDSDSDHSIKDKLVSKAFRDMDVVVEGKETAKVLRTHFFDLYRKWKVNKRTDSVANRYFEVTPHNPALSERFKGNPFKVSKVAIKVLNSNPQKPNDPNPVTEEIAGMIHSAETEIVMAQMNFNPDKKIKKALDQKKLHQPQIKTTLITNGLRSDTSFATNLFVWRNRDNYELVQNVFEYNIPEVLYHKKIVTIDSKVTFIGSSNFSRKSADLDNEVGIVIYSPEVTRMVNNILQRDILNSTKVKDETRESLGFILGSKILGGIQDKTVTHFF